MILEFKLSSGVYSIDTIAPLDISITMNFNGEQPNAYDAPIANSKTCEFGTFIGDTRRGGSCNFEEYRIIPHCNGTHTECVGHISLERISIISTLKDTFIPSTLITVLPEKALEINEKYDPEMVKNDLIIAKKSLMGLKSSDEDFLQGLIIRTLPNDDSKLSRQYMQNLPPYFTLDAMEFVSSLGVNHLLVDIPSVDRALDEGKLSAHHIFWDVERGSHKVAGNHSVKTITEMIFVPDELEDGKYLLNLQIASFGGDAAPSRPVIFRIKN